MVTQTLEPTANSVHDIWLSGVEGKDLSTAKLVADLNDLENDIPVQAYEDGNLTEVPSEFLAKNPEVIPTRIWGQDDGSTLQNDFVLPVVDMSALISESGDGECAKKVITEIGKACEEWGYFQAVNHGIPVSLLDRLLETADGFFKLPLEEKNVYASGGRFEGYGRMGLNYSQRLWTDMMRHTVRPKLSPEEMEKRIPAKPAHYRAVLEEYTQAVEKFLEIVWTSLSVYLDLQPYALRNAQEDGAGLVIRINYYPKCPEPEKVLGLIPHHDAGSLTVLLTDQVGGLQVQRPDTGDDVWLDVKPVKGSLLVNIGKQVEHLSNGRFKGMWHRVLVNRNESRYSIASFANPGQDCIISPVPELLEKSKEAPRFRQFRFRDYMPNFAADVKAGLSPAARYELNSTKDGTV